MGTKANPARFDCYANAEPDEPMFVLLARDQVGAELVRVWAMLRALRLLGDESILAELRDQTSEIRAALAEPEAVEKIPADELAQLVEALDCADAMEAWRAEHRPARGTS